MGPIIIIKSGTTSIEGDIVKGDFSYFSASTLDLGPTSKTGLYSGIDAPDGGYTIYQIGGPDGLNIRLATNTTELNSILITAGATGSTLNDRITWATNTNSIFVNSGITLSTFYYYGGQFTTVNVIQAPKLIQLNSDNSKDTTFNIGTGFIDIVYTTSIQSDEKILVGGAFTTFTGSTQNRLIRLNTDGSKDTTFNIGTGFNFDVYSTEIQSDGKILVGGAFSTFTGSTQNRLIRLNSDGSKDTTFNIGTAFNSNVNTTLIQSDGKILVGGAFNTFTGSTQNRLIRLNTDGSKDTTFDIGTGFDSIVRSINIQSDGKILVGGQFTTFTGSSQNYLIRLNSDGSKDATFNIGTGFNSFIWVIKLQSDGKILVGGQFTTFTGSSQNYLIRLNTDGSKDTTFNIGTGFDSTVRSIAIQTDGKILVGGSFTTFTGSSQNYLIRLNSDGSKDATFNIGAGFSNIVLSFILKSNGKILLGGNFNFVSGTTQNRFTKINGDSTTINESFNIGTGFDGNVYTTLIQLDGKILVGGTFTTFSGSSQNRLIRLNSDGSKDITFNIGSGFNNGIFSVAIQSDGKILVGGNFTTFTGSSQNYLIRLNSDGSKDTTFNIGTGFDSTVRSIAIQTDGKILVGGLFTTFTGSTQNRLIRLNTDGSKDTTFDIGTAFNNLVFTTLIQSDGKILVGGLFTTFTGSTQNRLIRLNTDGSKDTTFNIGTAFNSGVNTTLIQSDGKILVGGGFTTFTGSSQNRLIRLNTDGSKDTAFNIGTGFNSIVQSITNGFDEKLLVGGEFTTYNGSQALYNIILNNDGSLSNNQLTFNDFIYSINFS
jgi:uncharacterized delta-60 repeat protein